MHLTKTEKTVLKKILLSNQDIANDLTIAVSTVKTHIFKIMKKLKSKNRSIALIKAIRLKLLKLDEVDIGFWNKDDIYVEDIQEVDFSKE